MILHKENEDHDAESIRTLSDNGSEPFQVKPVRSNHNKCSRLGAIFVALGYLILGALSISLWVRFKRLESEVRILEPELFPCMSSGAF